MFAWLLGRKSHPAPQSPRPAPHTPPVPAEGAAQRAHTWPHASGSERGATPRDVHRHAPHGRDHYVPASSPITASRHGVDPTKLAGKLARVARRDSTPNKPKPLTVQTPGPQALSTQTPTPGTRTASVSQSSSSGSYTGFAGLGWTMADSTASVASAPMTMQHHRRASSARSLSISFDSLPHTEGTDLELAEVHFAAGHEPGMLFPLEVQLPEDHGLPGGRVVRKSLWEPADR